MQIIIRALNTFTKNLTDLIYNIDYCTAEEDYVIHREVFVNGRLVCGIDRVGRIRSLEEAMETVLEHVDYTGFEIVK